MITRSLQLFIWCLFISTDALHYGNADAAAQSVNTFELRHGDDNSFDQEPSSALQDPSDLVIYVTTYDASPVGDCAARSWISDAKDFGFQVVFYGQNATRHTRNGEVIPTRRVQDFGALSGVRDRYDVWPQFTAHILEDLLEFAPKAKFIMRMDDDSVLHPRNLWRSLVAMPLHKARNWMIGDCGNDEHHGAWCSGGAGIVMSRSLAEKLLVELNKGVHSVGACAVIGRNDDDTLGICAEELGARLMSHHGYHPFPPAHETRAVLPWWSSWPRLSFLVGGVPSLDGCPAEHLGPYLVVQDWITYHHASCDVQSALSFDTARRPKDMCAGALSSSRWNMKFSIDRCKSESRISQDALCAI